MSHEIVTSRKRRLCIWSNATCAMPLCEALSFRRGQRAHHAQMDRVGSWEVSCLAAIMAGSSNSRAVWEAQERAGPAGIEGRPCLK